MVVLGVKKAEANPVNPRLRRPLRLFEKVPYSLPVRKEWLETGIFEVPETLSKYMTGTNTVRVTYDDIDLILPYYEDTGIVEGVHDFYRDKYLAEGDSFYVGLRGLEPTQLLLCSGFNKTLSQQGSPEEND